VGGLLGLGGNRGAEVASKPRGLGDRGYRRPGVESRKAEGAAPGLVKGEEHAWRGLKGKKKQIPRGGSG
jgi:hypothetical protein